MVSLNYAVLASTCRKLTVVAAVISGPVRCAHMSVAARWSRQLRSRIRSAVGGSAQGATTILDAYVPGPPSGKNAIQIFAGEWSSRLPPPYDEITGQVGLFDDHRIAWLSEVLGGFEGLKVLELGPLEAGHTTTVERGGAASIVAVESNLRAYLKCLIVKELLGLQRSRFLLGDFVAYLRENTDTYDLCVASGVLYHMQEPVEVLDLLSRTASTLFLWTHYYDEAVVREKPWGPVKFPSSEVCSFDGLEYTRYRYEYGDALKWQGFCGGTKSFSYWLKREDILNFLRRVGYTEVTVGDDHPDHPNGPAFTVIARKIPAGP
jgi:hypothetical protein